jgi:chorismate mutase/prephenate dehydratase
LLKNEADAGVIPVENSTEGSVRETLDLLSSSDFVIRAEKHLKIEHCLLSKTERINEIISHPQALAQCQNFIRKNYPNAKVHSSESTAKAAEIASKEEGTAAIASRSAASLYNLKIIKENIQDSNNNYTRFFVVSKPEKEIPLTSNAFKTSIVFSLKNEPGSLYNALKVFAERKINLTKIESRPSKTSPWEYIFFLDFEGKSNDEKGALDALKTHTNSFKLLGSYPVMS